MRPERVTFGGAEREVRTDEWFLLLGVSVRPEMCDSLAVARCITVFGGFRDGR